MSDDPDLALADDDPAREPEIEARLDDLSGKFRSETDETLSSAVDLIRTFLRLPTAIWLSDRKSGEVTIRAGSGLTFDYLTIPPLELGDGSCIDRTLSTGEWRRIEDLAQEDFPYAKAALEAGWKSALSVPIQLQGWNLGVAQVFGSEEASFQPLDSDSLRQLTTMIGMALENVHRSIETEGLSQLANALSSKPDIESAMDVIAESVRFLTGADSSAIVLVNQQTGRFIVGRRSSGTKNKVVPRPEHGMTGYIIKEKESVIVMDTEDRDRYPLVNPQLQKRGIRSLLAVRLELQGEPIGVLYAEGHRPGQFTERERRILSTVADQSSVALGWTGFVLRPWRVIEEATANLFRLDEYLEAFCRKLCERQGEYQDGESELFDFSSVQLLNRDKKIIEPVYGWGISKQWVGRSRHFLHERREWRDIQADIVLKRPLCTEIIRGRDSRFDEGIYKEFDHSRLVRIFSPLLIVRNEDGRVDENWAENWDLWKTNQEKIRDEEGKVVGERTTIVMDPLTPAKNRHIEIDIIGTVEAGYVSPYREISLTQARELIEFSAANAKRIRSALLGHIQETIVEEARHIARSSSASLHFPYDPQSRRYLNQVRSRITADFLNRHPPREEGLGRQACRNKRPMFIPDPAQGDTKTALRKKRPDLYRLGIRAMAAFPLIVSDTEEGVIYLHYKEFHQFRDDEIRWVQLLAQRAVDAIRHASAYTRTRDRERQLNSLQGVTQYVVGDLEDPDLLYKIGRSALNTLAADIVTIYEYEVSSRYFHTPPAIVGRILYKTEMKTAIQVNDAPALLVSHGMSIFREEVKNDPILNPVATAPRKGPPFIAREGVKGCAGLLLKVAREIVGVMFVNYRRVHHFSNEDKRIIEALASAAAIAIKNRRLLEKRKQDLMVIAHNIQKPLTAATSYLEAFEKSLSEEEFGNQPWTTVAEKYNLKEDFDLARALADDVLEMSRSILTSFAREMGKKFHSEIVEIDAPKEIQKLCDRLQITNDRDDLNLVYETDPDFPRLFFDKIAFRTAIYNILHNAMKYSFKNTTIHLICRSASGTKGPQVEICSVGERIEDSEVERIFDKFQRANAIEATGRGHRGVGLGLWSARTSLKSAGGDLRLRLKGDDNQEACFILEFPASDISA